MLVFPEKFTCLFLQHSRIFLLLYADLGTSSSAVPGKRANNSANQILYIFNRQQGSFTKCDKQLCGVYFSISGGASVWTPLFAFSLYQNSHAGCCNVEILQKDSLSFHFSQLILHTYHEYEAEIERLGNSWNVCLQTFAYLYTLEIGGQTLSGVRTVKTDIDAQDYTSQRIFAVLLFFQQ